MFANKPNFMLSPWYSEILEFSELELQIQIRTNGTKENTFWLSWFDADPCSGATLGRWDKLVSRQGRWWCLIRWVELPSLPGNSLLQSLNLVSLIYYEDSMSTHTFGRLRPLNTSQPLSSWLVEKEGIILLTQCCHNQKEMNTLQQRGEARCPGTSGCGSLKLIWQRKTTVNLNFSLLPFTWA